MICLKKRTNKNIKREEVIDQEMCFLMIEGKKIVMKVNRVQYIFYMPIPK